MARFISRRLAAALIMLLGVTAVIFCIIRLQPGNPFLNMIQHDTDPTFLETKLQEIGYYDPLPVQYGKWLLRTIQFDLGYSIQHRASVAALIADRFGNTLLSAMYPNSLWDRALTVLSFIGVSIPVFFFGLLLIKVFGYDLAVLPFSGIETMGKNYQGIDRVMDIGRHMILPVTASALTQTATLLRYTRSSILSTVSEDYMKTAQAKGFTKKQAILRHGMRNARVSIITVLCNRLPDLLSGALIVETIFVWPGIGQLNYQAILVRDYPLIMGIALLLAVIVIGCNLLADVLCMILDPRVRNSVGV